MEASYTKRVQFYEKKGTAERKKLICYFGKLLGAQAVPQGLLEATNSIGSHVVTNIFHLRAQALDIPIHILFIFRPIYDRIDRQFQRVGCCRLWVESGGSKWFWCQNTTIFFCLITVELGRKQSYIYILINFKFKISSCLEY